MEYKGRYKIFDSSQIVTYPVADRINRVKLADLADPDNISGMVLDIPEDVEDNIVLLAEEIVAARKKKQAGGPIYRSPSYKERTWQIVGGSRQA